MPGDPDLSARLSRIANRARESSPLWAGLLSGPASPPYHSVQDFRSRVPRVDKALLFDKSRRELRDGLTAPASEVRAIIPSSGTSATTLGLSFLGEEDLGRLAHLMERYLDETFGTSRSRTVVVSLLPGGVRVPTLQTLSVYVGLRPDLAHGMLERFFAEFDQVVLVGEPLYAKHLLEYLHRRGVALRRERIHLVLGGDYLPENLRDYLAWLLGLRLHPAAPDPQLILSTFGVGEVGLHLLFETPRTVALRRFLRDRPRLVARLCGMHLASVPMFFEHDPSRVFVETEAGRLVFTMLEDRLQPVIRYDSGDWGGRVSSHALREWLPAELHGLLPPEGQDLVWMYGRVAVHWARSAKITAPRVQEALFAPARRLFSRDRTPRRGPALQAPDSPTRALASVTGHVTLDGAERARWGRRRKLRVRLSPPDGQGAFKAFAEAREVELLDAEVVLDSLREAFGAVFGSGVGGHLPFEDTIALSTQDFWDRGKEALASGLFARKSRLLPPEPTIRRAYSQLDKERIYRLRHQVFVVEEGRSYDALGARGFERTIQDPADHAATHFLAEVGGRVVGALRMVTAYDDFEDKEHFRFDDWTFEGEDEEAAGQIRFDGPFGVRFHRGAVGLVGRVCIARGFRGSRHGIIDGLLAEGLRYLAEQDVAAVFIDVSTHHVQRYLAAGFMEYQAPYVHRGTGQRYHTLIHVLDGLEGRRGPLRERTEGVWKEAWQLVAWQFLDNPPPLGERDAASGKDLIAWAALLVGLAYFGKPMPVMARPGDAFREMLMPPPDPGGIADALEQFLDAGRDTDGHGVWQQRTDALAKQVQATLRKQRLAPQVFLLPVVRAATGGIHPAESLRGLLDELREEGTTLARLEARMRTLRAEGELLELPPQEGAEPTERAVPIAPMLALWGQLVETAAWLLLRDGRAEAGIALKVWSDYQQMVLTGPARFRWRDRRRREAREAIAGSLAPSVRAPVVGNPFLEHARKLGLPAHEPTQTNRAAGSSATAPLESLGWPAEEDVAFETLADVEERRTTTLADGSSAVVFIGSTHPDRVGWLEAGEAHFVALGQSLEERVPVVHTDRPGALFGAVGALVEAPFHGPELVVGSGEILTLETCELGRAGRFRMLAPADDARFGGLSAEDFRVSLRKHPRLALTVVRQMVREARHWLAEGNGDSYVDFAITVEEAEVLEQRPLPSAVFRALTEGLEPHWLASGTVLFRRGDFADQVYLVDHGVVHVVRGDEPPDAVPDPDSDVPERVHTLSPWTPRSDQAGEWERFREAWADRLVGTCGPRRQLAGYWSALMPLMDPAVSGRRRIHGVAGHRTPSVQGVVEGESRSGPQPERYDVTGIVGAGDAVVYALPRQEFLRRLEAEGDVVYEVCRQVAIGVAIQAGARAPDPGDDG